MQGDVTDLDLQLHGVPACLRVGVPGMPPVIDREVRPSSRPRTAARVDIAPSSQFAHSVSTRWELETLCFEARFDGPCVTTRPPRI